MREIKFRALDNSGVWKYGYYRRVKNSPVNGKYINQHTITDNHFESLIKPETLGQYTGLKDKNGKEIYEGDIVEIVVDHPDLNHWNEFGEKLDVKYVDFGFEPFSQYDSDCGESLISDWCEIIGNIHENNT